MGCGLKPNRRPCSSVGAVVRVSSAADVVRVLGK
jgi:hypothetical protein